MTTSQLPRLPLQIKYKSNTTTFSLLMSAILLKNARKVKKIKKNKDIPSCKLLWDEKLATHLLGMSKNLKMKRCSFVIVSRVSTNR